MTEPRDGGFDDFVSALRDDDAEYLVCPEGHGLLPPQRICPECQSRELSRRPVPVVGEIETYTVVSLGTPSFSDDSPYVTAIARFGEVRLTGLVRSVDPEEVHVGQRVTCGVGTTETTGEQAIVFESV